MVILDSRVSEKKEKLSALETLLTNARPVNITTIYISIRQVAIIV